MGFSGRGAGIRPKSNTVQIQNDEYLGHDMEMNKDETSKSCLLGLPLAELQLQEQARAK